MRLPVGGDTGGNTIENETCARSEGDSGGHYGVSASQRSPLRSELPYMGFGNSERSRLLEQAQSSS